MSDGELDTEDSISISPGSPNLRYSIATTVSSLAESLTDLPTNKFIADIPSPNMSKPTTTFHGFSLLPDQIRLSILHHVAKLPRNCELRKARGRNQFYSPPPAILQVNRNIREQLQTFYLPEFIISSKLRSDCLQGIDFINGIWVTLSSPRQAIERKIYFNPEIDRLVIHQAVLGQFFKRWEARAIKRLAILFNDDQRFEHVNNLLSFERLVEPIIMAKESIYDYKWYRGPPRFEEFGLGGEDSSEQDEKGSSLVLMLKEFMQGKRVERYLNPNRPRTQRSTLPKFTMMKLVREKPPFSVDESFWLARRRVK